MIEYVGGSCPTQAQGRTASGRAFYFRARHGEWRLLVGEDTDPTEYPKWRGEGEHVAEGWDDTYGFMEDDDVLAILNRELDGL